MKILKTKSLPYIFLVLGLLFVFVNILNFASYYAQNARKTEDDVTFQKKRVETVLGSATQLLGLDQENQALDLIESGAANDSYDFFAVFEGKRTLIFSNNLGTFDSEQIPSDQTHFQIKQYGKTLYLTRRLVGRYDVTLGFFTTNENLFAPKYIGEILVHNIFDSFIYSLLIASLLGGIFKIIDLIKSGRLSDIHAIKSSSSAVQGLKSAIQTGIEIQNRNVPSLIPEGHVVEKLHGTQLGTTFKGGLIRVDLNKYSELCRSHGERSISTKIDPLFSEFQELAQRYGYYKLAEEGDERIYYSRGDDPELKSKMALSAIRGMYEISEKYADLYQSELNHRIKFKAAFSFGDLAYDLEGDKEKIKGQIFTDSARLIDLFKSESEKDYVTLMRSTDAQTVADLILESKAKDAYLPGLTAPGLTDKVVFITRLRKSPLSLIQTQFFKANSEIDRLLGSLLLNFTDESFWALNRSIRESKFHLVPRKLHTNLFQLLKECVDEKRNDEILASALMMIPHLGSTENFSASENDFLRTFLSHPNQRVIDNALEALGVIDTTSEEAWNFIDSKVGRTAANALKIVSRRELGPRVQYALLALLDSNEELKVLSGVYAANEIFSFYAERNLMVFKTAPFFRDVLAQIESLNLSPHEKIKTRAVLFQKIFEPLLVDSHTSNRKFIA